MLGNVIGGLSGPAIKPIALRCVHQVRQAVDIPIVGVGGIMSIDDCMEFFVTGASAVQVGTANFAEPVASMTLLDALPAALAELGIRFRLQGPLTTPEREGVGGALTHGFAPLQQQGPQAHLGQQQGREIPAGPCPDHHWAPLIGRLWQQISRFDHRAIPGVGGRSQMGIITEAIQQPAPGGFAQIQIEIKAVNQRDCVSTPCIDASAHQLIAPQGLGRDAQPPADSRRQFLLAVIQRKLDLAQPKQGWNCRSLTHGRHSAPLSPSHCRHHGIQTTATDTEFRCWWDPSPQVKGAKVGDHDARDFPWV
jgi:hypothetical protein